MHSLIDRLVEYFSEWEARELEEIKLDEGLVLSPYKDTVGIWTGGYGHAHIDPETPITLELAGQWLDEDFEEATKAAEKVCAAFSGLDGPRKGVIVNMAFNLGRKRLSQFHQFLAAVDIGDYATAAAEMLDSKWAKQVGKRAQRLAFRMDCSKYALRNN